MDKKTVLAIISPVFPPYRSGMGTVVRENARMGTQGGMEVHVFTPHYPNTRTVPIQEEQDGYTVHRLRPLFSYGNAAVLLQLFWRLRVVDTIHLHYPALGMELPVLFWSFFKKKLVTTYHMDLTGKGIVMRGFFRLYSAFFLPFVLARSSRVFVTSYDYAKGSPLIGSRVARYPERFIELPCSVDMSHFHPQMSDRMTQTILFVGALDSAHYSKGVSVLLAALAHVTDAKLVIIGDGDLRLSYEQRARELGIYDRVVFTGSIPHDALVRWYAGSLCLVLPSTDATEAFGVVIIEAASCGVSVIASNLRGVRSVVEEGVTGFLVSPGDAAELAEKIQYLISHPDRAKEMGGAARKRVGERYSYDNVAETYRSTLR